MRKGMLIGAALMLAVLLLTGQRTYTELIASFPDNHARLITPADMRNLVESVREPYGKITLDAPTLTTIAAQDTWTELAGAYTLNARARGVTLVATATGGKICNNSGNTWEFAVALSVSVAAASNNQEYQVTLTSDDTGVIGCLNLYSESRFAGIYESASGNSHFELDHGECLYAAIRNNTGAANFTAGTVLIMIRGISMPVGP